MSYSFTIDRIALGPDFESRLRHEVAAQHEMRRAAEQDGHRVNRLGALLVHGSGDKAQHTRHTRWLEQMADIQKARQDVMSLDAEMRVLHDDMARSGGAAAAALTQRAVKTLQQRDDAQARLEAAEQAGSEIAIGAHVPGRFDAQIENEIRAVLALVDGLDAIGAEAIKVQLGGHVGAEPTDRAPRDECVNVHVWVVA